MLNSIKINAYIEVYTLYTITIFFLNNKYIKNKQKTYKSYHQLDIHILN